MIMMVVNTSETSAISMKLQYATFQETVIFIFPAVGT
jgi:hypothetical protein